MRIMIHAVGADTGGAATHVRHMMSELGQAETSNLYWVLCREKFLDLQESKTIKFIFFSSKVSSSLFQRLWFDNVTVPQLLRKHKIDILVSLTNFGTIKAAVPHVVFQTKPQYFSPWYRRNASFWSLVVNRFRAQLAYLISKNAQMIVTPSNAMAEMMKSTFPALDRSKILTLYHGFDKLEKGDELPISLSKKIEFDGFKIIYPTLPAFHKGIFLLFDTIRELKNELTEPFRVLLTFDEKEALACYSHLKPPEDWAELCSYVVFLGKVPQAQIKTLLEASDLMFYPSLCESFGFSMVEAMGAGLPIVAVNTPINHEICQQGALYFEEKDPKAAARQIVEVLMHHELRERITNLGRERLTNFDWSWKRYCDDFEGILKQLKNISS